MIHERRKAVCLNERCQRLFSADSSDEAWFALRCTPSKQKLGKVSCLRVELERLEKFGSHSRTLSERVVEAMEGEQGRLSREVHDGVLQCIIGSRMLLDHVLARMSRENPDYKLLVDIEGCLAQANQEGRSLLENLRPATIEELGLAEALKVFLERMHREYGTVFEFDNQCEAEKKLPTEVRSNLFRVLQEAIHNAVKHSGSDIVKVSLGQGAGEAWIRVEDWGVGFEPERQVTTEGSEHFGLLSLRERAEYLGGECEISSRLGEGTMVEVRVPLELALKSGFSNLRVRAQSLLQKRPSDLGEEALVAELGTDEVSALIHEFEVHRVELEIQNNELRLAQGELMTSRDRFRALYEHTTFGYLEIDSKGRLGSANLTLSSMIGQPRHELVGRTLDSLLLPEFRPMTCRPGSYEVKLIGKADPGWLWAKLEIRQISRTRLQVSIEDLRPQHREAQQKAQVKLHLELARRKEALANTREDVFA